MQLYDDKHDRADMDQQPVIEIAEFTHNKFVANGWVREDFSQLKNNNKLFIETYLRPVNFAGNNQGTLSVFY